MRPTKKREQQLRTYHKPGGEVSELIAEIDALRGQIKEAKHHLDYLTFAWRRYREVGKEKMAICKMMAPMNCALNALDGLDPFAERATEDKK